MKKPNIQLAECNIGLQILADKCKNQSVGGAGTDVWVSVSLEEAIPRFVGTVNS